MQMRWLADGDPLKMQAFEQMPLIEYLMLLDQHVDDVQKAAKQAKRHTRL